MISLIFNFCSWLLKMLLCLERFLGPFSCANQCVIKQHQLFSTSRVSLGSELPIQEQHPHWPISIFNQGTNTSITRGTSNVRTSGGRINQELYMFMERLKRKLNTTSISDRVASKLHEFRRDTEHGSFRPTPQLQVIQTRM